MSSPVTAWARMSCQIGAVGEVHSTVEQFISVCMCPPEHCVEKQSFAPLGLIWVLLLPTACAVGCILTPLRGWTLDPRSALRQNPGADFFSPACHQVVGFASGDAIRLQQARRSWRNCSRSSGVRCRQRPLML